MPKIHLRNPLMLFFFLLFCSPALADKDTSGAVVEGDSVNSFFGSGANVDPMKMEQASIPADREVSLPPSHNVAAPKPGQTEKPHKFLRGVGRAFAHTANFIGFPVGADKDVDASLSSDLKNERNQQAWDQRQAAAQAHASTSVSGATMTGASNASSVSSTATVQP
jgi:hypothetical protein